MCVAQLGRNVEDGLTEDVAAKVRREIRNTTAYSYSISLTEAVIPLLSKHSNPRALNKQTKNSHAKHSQLLPPLFEPHYFQFNFIFAEQPIPGHIRDSEDIPVVDKCWTGLMKSSHTAWVSVGHSPMQCSFAFNVHSSGIGTSWAEKKSQERYTGVQVKGRLSFAGAKSKRKQLRSSKSMLTVTKKVLSLHPLQQLVINPL